jgi:arylsulfatase A-like enzyme
VINRLRIVFLALLLAACTDEREPAAVSGYRTAAEGKNIVMVLLDAAAYRHFGFAGYDRNTTPNIDALAAESVVFDQAYAPAASTAHSVYGLLTSMHSFIAEEAGLRGELEDPFRVTESTQLMPELLAPVFKHRAGITGNAWFGPDFGLDRGFSYFYEAYQAHAVPDSTKPVGGRVLDLFLKDLDSWGEGPEFSYVHFLEPHTPYTPPDPFAHMFDATAADSLDGGARALVAWRLDPPSLRQQEMTRALYDANLAYADSLVGELIAALKDRGEWDNTIFILIADHGEAFWQHGVWGHGRHIFDEFVRIPMLLRMPGVEGLAEHHVEEVVSLKDLLPTYLDLLSLPAPDQLEGLSLLPLIAGETGDFQKRMVFTRGTHGIVPEFGLRYGNYKWIYRVREGSYQLYDMIADPEERHDLVESGEIPDGLSEIRKEIALWIASGTGRVEAVEALDPETEERLRAIGYF